MLPEARVVYICQVHCRLEKSESVERRWVQTRHMLHQALIKFLDEDSLMVSASTLPITAS